MMSKSIYITILCVTCLLVSCGKEINVGSQPNQSQEVVSGTAVVGKPSESRKIPFLPQYPMSNSQGVYMGMDTEGEYCFRQWDGREIKKYEPEGFEQVLFADDNWIYYLVWQESDQYDHGISSVYRAPLKQKENQVEPDIASQEMVFQESPDTAGKKAIWDWGVVNGKYVVGLRGDGKLLIYSIEAKQTTISTIDDRYEHIWESDSEILGQIRNTIFLYVEENRENDYESGLYCYDLKKGIVSCLEEKTYFLEDNNYVFSPEEKCFIYMPNHNRPDIFRLKKYALGKKESRDLLGDMGIKAVEDAIESALHVSMDDVISKKISQVYCWNGRVYIQLSVFWKEGTNEYFAKNFIFSMGLNEQDVLTYEEEITKVLHENSKIEKIQFRSKYPCTIVRDECITIVDGMCLFDLGEKQPGEEEDKIGCYDIEEKTYYECLRNCSEMYQYCEGTRQVAYNFELDWTNASLYAMVSAQEKDIFYFGEE
nr:hypothetical protein [Eubacterium sp.]